MNETPLDEVEVARLRQLTRNEASQQRTMMSSLISNPSFQFFIAQLKKQIDQRLNELLLMPQGSDDLIRKTYSMGEMAGLKLAIAMPEVLIEYAKTSLESANRFEEETENFDGESTSDDETSDELDGPDSDFHDTGE